MDVQTAGKPSATNKDPYLGVKILFVNWSTKGVPYDSCDLFDEKPFGDYDIVFFDPLEFAIQAGFRTNTTDIAEMEFVSLTETTFLTYITEVKSATISIRNLLKNGGILVIRSQIPNTELKIKRKSSVGSRQYTESVVAPFFWLEELIGTYEFPYLHQRNLRFVERNNPLKKVFGGVPVNCVQTQNRMSRGKAEPIALTHPSPKYPAISRIHVDGCEGHIYFVPRFIVRNETDLLCDAFSRVKRQKLHNLGRISWMRPFESDIETINPYTPEIERIDREIDTLKRLKGETLTKSESTCRLLDLLVEKGTELELATASALELLGYSCAESFGVGDLPAHNAMVKEDRIYRLLVHTAMNEREPIGAEELEVLIECLKNLDESSAPKPILVGNTCPSVNPNERLSWFNEDCVSLARRHDICLLPSFELYKAASYILRNATGDYIEDTRASIRKDFYNCDSIFRLNAKRYPLSFK